MALELEGVLNFDQVCFEKYGRIWGIFGAYSVDVVTSTSFSMNIDSMSNPSDPFVTNIKKFLKFSFLHPIFVLLVLLPFVIPVLEKMNMILLPSKVIDFFKDVFIKMKKEQEKVSIMDQVDFLQLMVDSQSSHDSSKSAETNSYKSLSNEEILAQALFFIFAGYETTNSTLSYIAHNLATHPNVQQQLQDGIDVNLPNKVKAAPIYSTIMQMEHLDMVLSESLQLFPTGGQIERVCKKTAELSGVTIPKGMVMVIPTYVLDRDPGYWPEPEEFRPERFSKEKKKTIDPYTFLPFGAGLRNCIGMRFALLIVAYSCLVSKLLIENLQKHSAAVSDHPTGPQFSWFDYGISLQLQPSLGTALQILFLGRESLEPCGTSSSPLIPPALVLAAAWGLLL